MAYDKQTWMDGDLITAEKLNHMEDGIDGASCGCGNIVLFYQQNETWHTNASYSDAKDKLINGDPVFACFATGFDYSEAIGFEEPGWCTIYYEPNEDDIIVQLSSTDLRWTESGVTPVK